MLDLTPAQAERLKKLKDRPGWNKGAGIKGPRISTQRVNRVKELLAIGMKYDDIKKECGISKPIIGEIKKGTYHGFE